MHVLSTDKHLGYKIRNNAVGHFHKKKKNKKEKQETQHYTTLYQHDLGANLSPILEMDPFTKNTEGDSILKHLSVTPRPHLIYCGPHNKTLVSEKG